jgi:hypothetical protein
MIGLALSLLFAGSASADVGVGVSLGRIEITDQLLAGRDYRLPALGVLNTGDEPGTYEVAITYRADQQQRRPSEKWFELEPRRFHLDAGSSQNVEVRLVLPDGVDPGDYFAYLEARPVSEGSGVRVGVAAATRVTFTVKPSSWWQAQQIKMNRWLDETEPWSYIIPGSLIGGLLFMKLSRHVRFRSPIERRP